VGISYPVNGMWQLAIGKLGSNLFFKSWSPTTRWTLWVSKSSTKRFTVKM